MFTLSHRDPGFLARSVSSAVQGPQDFTFDADSNDPACITMGAGSNVSAFLDRSVNGYDFSQATSADQPTLVDDSGIDVLRFIRDNSQFLAGNDYKDYFDLDGLTMIARIRLNSIVNINTESEAASSVNAFVSGSYNVIGLGARTNGGNLEAISMAHNSGYAGFILGRSMTEDAWTDLAVKTSGSTLYIYVNGTATSTSISSNLVSEAGTLQIGRSASGAVSMPDFDLRRLRTYDYALTDQQIADVSSEWG